MKNFPNWVHPYETKNPRLQNVTNEIGGDYDLYMYVRHSGKFPSGVAGNIGSICDKDSYKFLFFKAFGPDQCLSFLDFFSQMRFQSSVDCTATNRMLFTAEVIFVRFKRIEIRI